MTGTKLTSKDSTTVSAAPLPASTAAEAVSALTVPHLSEATRLYRLEYGSSAISRARLMAKAICR